MLFKDIGLVGLIVRGREKTILKMTALAMLLNLGLNFVVIPRYGMTGAACTTLLTEVLRAGMAGWCLRRDNLPVVGLKRTWRPLVSGGAMAAVLLLIGPSSVFTAIPIGAVAYALALFALGGIELRRGHWPALRV